MSEESQQNRRIVSKGKYVSFLGIKAAISVIAIVASLLGLAALFLVLWLVPWVLNPMEGDSIWELLIPLLILACLASGLWCIVFASVRGIQKMEPVVPLTRHNTGDLPEEETLVRASEEPPANQSNVLLRAAQGSQETPEEQLLRPLE